MAVRIVFGTVSAALLAQAQPTFWMPPELSVHAARVDWVFNYILCMSLFFFLLVVGLMTYFVIRFRRRRSDQQPLPSPSHSTRLEILWLSIVIPVAASMFYFGLDGYVDLAVAPLDSYPVKVTGQKWKWQFEYPTRYIDEDLHVPVGRDIELTMTSTDVNYSLFIPAMRIKRDVVPGRHSRLWFRAEHIGEYPLLCAQYCGTGYSTMTARLIVHSHGEFEQWLAQANDFLIVMPPTRAGQRLHQIRGCKQCHSIDSSVATGPTFENLFGHEVVFVDGSRQLVDEGYIRNCVLDPASVRLPGFAQVMPRIEVNDAEIDALAAFIQSLSYLGRTPTAARRAAAQLAEAGKRLYHLRACKQCHSIDGSVATGPTFHNLFGREVVFADGSRHLVDEDYLRNCILDPASVRLLGFSQVMPRMQLTDSELDALIAFVRSLSNPAVTATAPEGSAEAEPLRGGCRD